VESLVVMLMAAGPVLLVSGIGIQFTSRSPFSNTPMDDRAQRRFRTGTRMAAAGFACILAIQLLLRFWR
jgi:hypothetical protein